MFLQFIFLQKIDMTKINIFTSPKSLKELAFNRSKMNNAFTARYTCYKNVCPRSNCPINPLGHIIAPVCPSLFSLAWLEEQYGIVNACHELGNKNQPQVSIFNNTRSVKNWCQIGLLFIYTKAFRAQSKLEKNFDLEIQT